MEINADRIKERNLSLDRLASSISSLQSLKQSYIGESTDSHIRMQEESTLVNRPPGYSGQRSRTSSVSSLSSITSQGELVRIPGDSLVITKEKTKQPAQVHRERSRPSQGSSAQTSGRATPVVSKPHKPMSEAAVRLNANLLSHNDRLEDEEVGENRGPVFNAEYSVSSPPDIITESDQSNHTCNNESLQPPFHNTSEWSNGHDTPNMTIAERTTSQPSRQSSRNSLHNVSSDSHEVSHLAKRNAQLEGQVEMITNEVEHLIQERATLQTDLAQLKSQLKIKSKETRSADLHTDDSTVKLKQEYDKITYQYTELSKRLETKELELKKISEHADNVQELNSKLQSAITDFKSELKTKDEQLLAARNELRETELQVSINSTDSQTLVDKISALQDDITSLTQTKEWYQQQLHNAQDMRHSLQSEVTQLRNLVSNQTDVLERMKVENTQLRHQLAETQNKALSEKQLLMRHLESIEADMLERETGFEAMEHEKGLSEQTWQHKMMQIEKERMALSKMVTESTDFERRLQTAQHNLESKSSELELVQQQQAELEKRLMVAQESLQVTNKELEFTREKLIESENTLTKVQKQDRERGNLLQSLKQDKASLQVALSSANEEKAAFSKAVETLKENTTKVEQNYKKMKSELTERTALVDQLRAENRRLVEQAETVKVEQITTLKAEPPKTLNDNHEKIELMNEHMNQLKTGLEYSEERIENLNIEKKTLEQQVTNLKSNSAELEHLLQKSHADKRNLETQMEDMMRRLNQYKNTENSERQLQSEKTTLNNKVESLSNQLKDQQTAHQTALGDYESSMSLLRDQLEELRLERDAARRELKQHEETTHANSTQQQEHLYAQISMLRGQLEATQIQKTDLENKITSYHNGVQSAVDEYQKRLQEVTAALNQTTQRLDEERAECQATVSRYRSECKASEQLSLDLEKEKGKVQALKGQLVNLKQHVTTMEQSVAKKEAVIQELTNDKMNNSRRSNQYDEETQLRLTQLQTDLVSQSERCDQLQQQLAGEMDKQTSLESRANTLLIDNNSLQKELDEKALQVASIQAEVKTINELNEKQSSNIAMLNREYRSAKIELDQLRRSASELAAKSPIINDELQALQWTAKQKTQESVDAQNQLKLAEQRMNVECENLRRSLAETCKELDIIKMEVEAIRRDKFSYQNKSAQLRSALKNLLNQFKALTDSLPAEIPKPRLEDEEKYDQLLQETAAPSYKKSKPLENLKSCLAGLNTEISTLQHHMDEHKQAIQHNNDSWKEMETEVADLEKLIAASRQASKNSQTSAGI